jgi:hypothetical protein
MAVSGGLHVHDVGNYGDAIDLLGDIVNLNLDRSRARRGHAVVSDFLMDDADEVGRLAVIHLKTEIAIAICLGVASFFHALPEFEENDVIPGSGLVRSGIPDYASESLRASETTENHNYQKKADFSLDDVGERFQHG